MQLAKVAAVVAGLMSARQADAQLVKPAFNSGSSIELPSTATQMAPSSNGVVLVGETTHGRFNYFQETTELTSLEYAVVDTQNYTDSIPLAFPDKWSVEFFKPYEGSIRSDAYTPSAYCIWANTCVISGGYNPLLFDEGVFFDVGGQLYAEESNALTNSTFNALATHVIDHVDTVFPDATLQEVLAVMSMIKVSVLSTENGHVAIRVDDAEMEILSGIGISPEVVDNTLAEFREHYGLYEGGDEEGVLMGFFPNEPSGEDVSALTRFNQDMEAFDDIYGAVGVLVGLPLVMTIAAIAKWKLRPADFQTEKVTGELVGEAAMALCSNIGLSLLVVSQLSGHWWFVTVGFAITLNIVYRNHPDVLFPPVKKVPCQQQCRRTAQVLPAGGEANE